MSSDPVVPEKSCEFILDEALGEYQAQHGRFPVVILVPFRFMSRYTQELLESGRFRDAIDVGLIDTSKWLSLEFEGIPVRSRAASVSPEDILDLRGRLA